MPTLYACINTYTRPRPIAGEAIFDVRGVHLQRHCKRFPIKRTTPKSKILNSRRRRRRVRNWRNRNYQYPEGIFILAHQRETRHFSPGPSANARARRRRRRNLQRPENMKQPLLPPPPTSLEQSTSGSKHFYPRLMLFLWTLHCLPMAAIAH